jgi:hypothetical protein
MTYRRLTPSLVALMSTLSLAAPLSAQERASDPNPALRQATIDEAALGITSRVFAEFSTYYNSIDWIGAAGVSLGGGMLRASYGKGANQRNYGLGFARPIVAKSFGVFGTLTSGVDLGAAIEQNDFSLYRSRAMRMSLPLSWRIGSPSRFSIAPYVAPYAELGRAVVFHGYCPANGTGCGPGESFPDQTRSLGLGAGVDITAWRFGFLLGMTGVPTRLNLYRNGAWTENAAVRIRF